MGGQSLTAQCRVFWRGSGAGRSICSNTVMNGQVGEGLPGGAPRPAAGPVRRVKTVVGMTLRGLLGADLMAGHSAT